jgi:hypothetical protein
VRCVGDGTEFLFQLALFIDPRRSESPDGMRFLSRRHTRRKK